MVDNDWADSGGLGVLHAQECMWVKTRVYDNVVGWQFLYFTEEPFEFPVPFRQRQPSVDQRHTRETVDRNAFTGQFFFGQIVNVVGDYSYSSPSFDQGLRGFVGELFNSAITW